VTKNADLLARFKKAENEGPFRYLLKPGHPYHLIAPSSRPFFGSMSIFIMLCGTVQLFYTQNSIWAVLGFLSTVYVVTNWLLDVVQESSVSHSPAVRRGLRIGFALFLVSEIMFFFGFFWAFFHSSLSPAIQIGAVWPPRGIETIPPFGLPAVNTIILLTSGAAVTWAHYAILAKNRIDCGRGLTIAVFLGLLFTALQLYEYTQAPFSIADGIYGSVFYLTTGFHGFHVIVGTIFLLVCALRVQANHFRPKHHVGLECAIWYWHFVDVVWLFLYITVYCWGC
jgi:heme/copper-type cytochrome/quinol oxidase subunit 3